MSKPKTPNEALRYHRELRNWTQEQAAEALQNEFGPEQCGEVSAKTISNWERGVQIPSLKYRDKLCRLYKVSSPEELGFLKREKGADVQVVSQGIPSLSIPLTPSRHLVEQQGQEWLTIGTSYLGQLFDEGWSTNNILNALKIVLQGIEGMPATIKQSLLEQSIGTITPFFTKASISEEEQTKLHLTLSESIITSWKLFLSTNCTQMLAIGQTLLFLIQRSSAILYPAVLPLYYSSVYRLIGAALFFQARYAEALQAHEQAYITALQANDAWNMAESIAWQANVWQACGKHHVSIQLLEQALRLTNSSNDSRSYAIQAKLLAQWAENAALLHEPSIAEEKLNDSAALLNCFQPNDEFDTSIWHYYKGTCALYLDNPIKADTSFQLALQGYHSDWILQNTTTTLLHAKALLGKKEFEGSFQTTRRAFPLVLALDSSLLSWGFIDFVQVLQNYCSGNREVKSFAEEVRQRLPLPTHRRVSRYLEAELV